MSFLSTNGVETQNLIMSREPVVGKVLKCVDETGLAEWADESGGGGSSSIETSNLGAGEVITVAQTTVLPGPVEFKTLTSGANITLTSTANEIEISAAGGGGDIEVNNLGAGEGVASTTGTIALPGPVEFKSLVGSPDIAVTSGASTLTIGTAFPNGTTAEPGIPFLNSDAAGLRTGFSRTSDTLTSSVEGVGVLRLNSAGSVIGGNSLTALSVGATVGSLAFGYTETGGVMTVAADGAVAMGFSSGAGSSLFSSGRGSIAGGRTNLNADVFSGGDGSFAWGNASTNSSITSSGTGSRAGGSVSGTNGAITSSGTASFAHGSVFSTVSNNSSLNSSGIGTTCLGYALSGGLMNSRGTGGLCFGQANGANSSITTGSSSNACLAAGFAESAGTIECGDVNGATARGYANNGTIEATGNGSAAWGVATTSGTITAGPTDASTCFGFATGTGSSITSNGLGCLTLGSVESGGTVLGGSSGSICSGSASDSAQIRSVGSVGSYCVGLASGVGSLIEHYGDVSMILGAVETSAQILIPDGNTVPTLAPFSRASAGTMIRGMATGSGSLLRGGPRGSTTVIGSVFDGGRIVSSDDTSVTEPGEAAYCRGVVFGGLIQADEHAVCVTGYVDGADATLRASGRASHAHAHLVGNAAVLASGSASFVNVTVDGVVSPPAEITASGNGAAIFGAYSESSVTCSNPGSMFVANAAGSSTITSVASDFSQYFFGNLDSVSTVNIGNASGSNFVFANVNASTVNATGRGASILGIAFGGSTMNATNIGSCAIGLSDTGGTMTSSNIGSFSHGAARNDSTITASGIGSHAFGISDHEFSEITASGTGSFAWGRPSGLASGSSGGKIIASGTASVAYGEARDGTQITCASIAGFSSGLCLGGSIRILSTAHAAFVRGYTGTSSPPSTITVGGGAGGNAGFCSGVFARQFSSSVCTVTGNACGVFCVGGAAGDTVTVSGNSCFLTGGLGTNVLSGSANTLHGQHLSLDGASFVPTLDNCMILGQFATAKTSSRSPGLATYGDGTFFLGGGASSADGPADGISLVLHTSAYGATPTGEGVANAWVTGGADYAEYFEWADGNVKNEDRVGYFVTLSASEEGADKIVLSSPDDDDEPIGVSSSSTSPIGVVGDAAELRWHGANERDEFGRLKIRYEYKTAALKILREELDVYEGARHEEEEGDPDAYAPEIEACRVKIGKIESMDSYDPEIQTELGQSIVPKPCTVPSEKYDIERDYESRKYRPEWSPISLVGKVFVRDDGTCVAGKRCAVKEGGVATLAQPGTTTKTYRVLSRSSPSVVRIFIK